MRITKRIKSIAAALLMAAMAVTGMAATDADVIVYGGTPGGLAATIAAARQGSRVILVEPNFHVGGMTASGLGKSDIENRFFSSDRACCCPHRSARSRCL